MAVASGDEVYRKTGRTTVREPAGKVSERGNGAPARMTGTVSLVQEQRFLLAGARGDGHFFLLSHDATLADGTPADGSTLEELVSSGQRVAVEFTPSAELLALVAHRLEKSP